MELIDDILNLVDSLAGRRSPAPPLSSVNPSEVPVRVGPFIPDGDLVFIKVFDIGVAAKKPKEFVNYRTQVNFFGGQERKAVPHIKSHLMAKNADGSRACAIRFFDSIQQDFVEQIVVSLQYLLPKLNFYEPNPLQFINHSPNAKRRGFEKPL